MVQRDIRKSGEIQTLEVWELLLSASNMSLLTRAEIVCAYLCEDLEFYLLFPHKKAINLKKVTSREDRYIQLQLFQFALTSLI